MKVEKQKAESTWTNSCNIRNIKVSQFHYFTDNVSTPYIT